LVEGAQQRGIFRRGFPDKNKSSVVPGHNLSEAEGELSYKEVTFLRGGENPFSREREEKLRVFPMYIARLYVTTSTEPRKPCHRRIRRSVVQSYRNFFAKNQAQSFYKRNYFSVRGLDYQPPRRMK